MMNDVLIMTDVCVDYGNQRVLNHVSLKMKACDRVALLGLNGSGKTTLLYTIAGLLPYKGEITVGGLPLIKTNENSIRENLGFLFSVPEDQILFPHVIDDVAFGLIRKDVTKEEAILKAGKMLEFFNIAHAASSSPYHLSHGERQRVALAGTLVTAPKLLLLDEPSASLDPVGKKSLIQSLKSIDAAMIIATHDLESVSELCTHFIVLHHGSIVKEFDDPRSVSHYWSDLC